MILLNPAQQGGERSLTRIQMAASVLGYDEVAVANLFSVPTRDSKGIRVVGQDEKGWVAARANLRRTIATSHEVMVGWGVHRPTGPAGVHFRDQVDYVHHLLQSSGKTGVWTMGGEARHPSRWHQYVSERHGRATGADFRARLESVVVYAPLESLL